MRAKGMTRWVWVLVLAVLITAWLVLAVSSSAQMVKPQVAAGNWHTVGLKSDGTVVAVGQNDSGQLNVGDWSNIVQVAADAAHTVGLKSDGTVVAWEQIFNFPLTWTAGATLFRWLHRLGTSSE